MAPTDSGTMDPALIAARRAQAAADALAEAEARRLARAPVPAAAREINGPAGIEPTLHGDWLVNGRVSDF